MNTTHVRAILTLGVAALAAAAILVPAFAGDGEDASQQIVIDVSPSTLNLQSSGTVVTVHADIAYDEVDIGSVVFHLGEYGAEECDADGCDEYSVGTWRTEADDLGDFVASFAMADVRDLNPDADEHKTNERNTFVLWGLYRGTSTSFWGTQDVMVIDEGGRRPSGPRQDSHR